MKGPVYTIKAFAASLKKILTASATHSNNKGNGSKTDPPARKALNLCAFVYLSKPFFAFRAVAGDLYTKTEQLCRQLR